MENRDLKHRKLNPGESQIKQGDLKGRYCYSFYDGTGKRHQVTSWRLTAADPCPKGKRACIPLRDLEKEVNAQVSHGIDFTGGNKTLNELFDYYSEKRNDLKMTSKSTYQCLYDHNIREALGKRKIKSITYSDIWSLYVGMLKDGDSKSKVISINAAIAPIFKMAVRDKIIAYDPSEGAANEAIKGHGKPPKVRHALTDEQIKTFLREADQDRQSDILKPLAVFLLGTGLRIGEALGLRWEDVDFDQGLISINHIYVELTDSNRKIVSHITTPKSASSVRTVPLFTEARKALEDIRGLHRKCTQTIDGFSNFIFIGKNGKVKDIGNIALRYRNLCKRCNDREAASAKAEEREPVLLPEITPHVFRHTFCTKMLELTDDVKLVSTMLGHKSINTTMDIYNEIREDRRKESYKRLDGIFRIE